MIDDALSYSIKILARPEPDLKSGELVAIQVIKKLTRNKWAIGFRGKVYPAKSEIELYPGQILKVLVFKKDGFLRFRLWNEASSADLKENHPKQGTVDLSRQIIGALVSSEMIISPEIIKKIKHLVQGGGDLFMIRVLAILLGKNIEPSPGAVRELAGLLDYGSRRKRSFSGGGGQEKNPPGKRGIMEWFSGIISGKEGVDNNLLQVFNHKKGRGGTWIVLPYSFSGQDFLYAGTFKLLINNFDKTIKRAALVVNTAEGTKWSFAIKPERNLLHVMAFCNEKVYTKNKDEDIHSDRKDDRKAGNRTEKSKYFENLLIKLQNIGVRFDDNIYSDEYFDGFSPVFPDNTYKSVDTVI